MKWDEGLASYERELTGRGAAERTRRAYRNDLVQFTGWAMERGHRAPDQVEHRDVRLFAARLSESGAAAAAVGRKVPSAGGLYAHQARTGCHRQNSAPPDSTP